MKKTVMAMLLTLILVFSLIGAASAITDGELDGNGHPYVGIMVAKDSSGAPQWRCSGTLIAPTVFLTAGHCTEAPAASVEIWFDNDIEQYKIPNPADPTKYIYTNGYPNTGEVSGTPYTHPEYNPNAFFYRDLGIVVLDEPVYMDTYGALPEPDVLDTLKSKRGLQDLTFTAVGYGLQMSFPDAAAWKESALKIRMVAHPKLIQINVPGYVGDFSLLLSNNAKTGGTCFGDSGGPNFIGNTNVIGGVTSFGKNGTCGGTGGVFRVDRSWSLNWINSFLE